MTKSKLSKEGQVTFERLKEQYSTTCPTHKRLLLPTKTTGQLVCPIYECDYWKKVNS